MGAIVCSTLGSSKWPWYCPRTWGGRGSLSPGLTLPRGGMLLSDEIWAVNRARHKICSSWPHLAFWGGGDRLMSEPFCSQICFLFTKTNSNSKTRSIPPSPFSHRVTQLSAPISQSLTVTLGSLLGRTQGELSQPEGLFAHRLLNHITEVHSLNCY